MVNALTDFITWSINNFWVYILLIVLFIYEKYRNKETVGNLKLKEMYIIVEIGFYFLLIYLAQKYLFYEHWFLIISLPFLIGFNIVFINYILNKDNVYLVETALRNDTFYNAIENKPVLSLTTRLRILIMDREYYESKKHIGEIYNPIQQLSRNIKFCDFHDDNTGYIYHSDYPELQNINFYTRIAFWLNIKKELPEIIKQNIKLTWLETYKTFYQVRELAKQHKIELKGVRELIDKKPFEIFQNLDEYIQFSNQLKKFEHSENEISNEGDTTDN